MTITKHASERINERYIPYSILVKVIKNGKIRYYEDSIRHDYKGICVVTSLNKKRILTAHFQTWVNELIESIMSKYKLTFRDAIKMYYISREVI